MNLLPSDDHEFHSKEYWESFFTKRDAEAFEWYGEFSDVRGLLSAYCPKGGEVLVVGCGNSSLSDDLYDQGYESVVSIDFSEVVIKEMEAKQAARAASAAAAGSIFMGGAEYVLMDMLNMEFPDGRFLSVVDKGALDALASEDDEATRDQAARMFVEVGRVLAEGGVYVCISLAQPHVLASLLDGFQCGYQVTAHTFTPSGGSALCPFLFVFRKNAAGAAGADAAEPPTTYGMRAGADKRAGLGRGEFAEAVREQQRMYDVKRNMGRPVQPGTAPFSMDLWMDDDSKAAGERKDSGGGGGGGGGGDDEDGSGGKRGPRYTVTVLDADLKPSSGSCAVVLVPQGREHEFLFGHVEGQVQLARQAGYARLLIVNMNRGHDFSDINQVKKEYVLEKRKAMAAVRCVCVCVCVCVCA